MLRLLPLLALALLPAAVAAPVPPGGRVEFGAHGLLTRADLEKVRFDSRPSKPDDPKFPRPEYDLAVHMPWATFREGEPVPAYFVLKNNDKAELPLGGRMELFGPRRDSPTFLNGCGFTVRDRATGKSVEDTQRLIIACGGGAMMTVPAGGFYVVSGDVGRTNGKPLPPGEYEVEWQITGRLRSAPVRFTVINADGAKPTAARERHAIRFYRLAPTFEREEREAKPGEPFVWRDRHLGYENAGPMSAALAVGQHGVYVPDLHTVPAADELVEASVAWKPYREGDRVAVTLRSARPGTRVRFEELPQLYLQVEAPDEEAFGRWDRASEAEAKRSASDDERLVTPLTIEVQFPKEWRGRMGVNGTGRVAVLVLAKPVEFPRGGQAPEKMAVVKRVRVREEEPLPVWSGLVRTAFTELRFPSPALPAR